MEPYYADDQVTLWLGDSLEVLRQLPDGSVDSIVTDPPYGLGFMGKKWDALPPGEEWARECLRVLKPGGHLLAFGGTRTWHRLAVAVEDAGFEIRDSIAWMYGSGFPKSLDVSKAIDKAAGAERGSLYVAHGDNQIFGEGKGKAAGVDRTPGVNLSAPPATPDAEQWQGWGTALKPAFEPVIVGRKPLAGTVAANVLAHGTGALNIDGCRVETDERIANHHGTNGAAGVTYGNRREYVPGSANSENTHDKGRWPANVVLDESQAAALDEQVAGVSRFFYVSKAPKKERPNVDGVAHPTVKPLALMRWLVRLIAPPGGLVLDPFAGSGTTGEAALREGFRCLLVEAEADYLPLIEARIARADNFPLTADT